MTTKRCFKCLCEKPFEDFYKHSKMGDGHLGKCKECTKKDVLEHRLNNLETVRAYDKFRSSMPHRVAARKEYAKTPNGKLSHAKALKNNRERFPQKAQARTEVQKALKRGDLTKTPCHICGDEKVHGHHPDYSRPLDVVWLCVTHHTAIHSETF